MIFHYDIPYHHHHHYMTHLPTVEVEYGVHDYCPGELCLGESKRSQNLKLMTWVMRELVGWVGIQLLEYPIPALHRPPPRPSQKKRP